MILIYTCKARLNQALQLYDMLWIIEEKKYIVYGDSLEEEYRLEDKYLILNVGDYYEHLTQKTKKMFEVVEKFFPGEYVLKMDDDIIPNCQMIMNCLHEIKENSILYAGKRAEGTPHYSCHHFGKVNDPAFNVSSFVPANICACGPLYCLHPDAISILNKETETFLYEDATVGYLLNKNNIFPTHIEFYDDYNIHATFHNHYNHKKIYIKLHGGLGNQLFQVASAYGLAKKHNRILILVSDFSSYSFTHPESDQYAKTIFKSFHLIHQHHLPSMDTYCETDNIQCFQHQSFIGNENIFIRGYLQTEEYFKEYKEEIRSWFQVEQTDSFFIHVRRGDIANWYLYALDYDTYYQKALDHIESFHPNAHYYIFSDDIEYCKQYKVFEPLNKTFVEDTPLNSLLKMASCTLGGICCNSTFSWWGSYLNENPNKMVIFPSTWINNGHDNKGIYYEGSIII